MDISVNTDGLDGIFEACQKEVMARMEQVGQEFVQDAVNEGTYHNVTGNLRRSNYYEVTEQGLELGNKADYASDVEARGEEVVSTFALRALAKLEQ